VPLSHQSPGDVRAHPAQADDPQLTPLSHLDFPSGLGSAVSLWRK
jgi:hypothetical protein